MSADAPSKRQVGSEAFATWVRAYNDALHISAVTIAEIEAGIAHAVRIGATTNAGRLRSWLDAVEHLCGGRILSFGVEEPREAGAMLDRAGAHDPGFEDIAIAAAAAVRGFTVLTANERHFASLGVLFINPLKQLPAG